MGEIENGRRVLRKGRNLYIQVRHGKFDDLLFTSMRFYKRRPGPTRCEKALDSTMGPLINK